MMLFMVRHLPTAWGVEGRLQGSTHDIAILPPKPEEIRPIVAELKALEPFELVLVSTLRRSHQSAAPFGFSKPTVEPLLDEMDFGIYAGGLRSEFVKDLASGVAAKRLGGGPEKMEQNIRSFFTKYKRRGRVLAIAHGAWMRAAVSISRHGDTRLLWDYRTPTDGVLRVEL
jgi:broad specificity phosphatase PhoE